MEEKFYCVGCKQHYELEVHAAQRQPSKGGSFRHSLISECPKGHRVNKLCKKEAYEKYSVGGLPFAAETFEAEAEKYTIEITGYAPSPKSKPVTITGTEQELRDQLLDFHDSYDRMVDYGIEFEDPEDEEEAMRLLTEKWNKLSIKEICDNDDMLTLKGAEEGSAPVQDPMEFGEMANWTPLDGTPSLKKRKRAEGMTVGVGLEALEPTPDEPETGVSMVPADSLMPEGSGHVIGSQSTSHNFTPFHAEKNEDGNYISCPKCGYEPPVYEVGEEMPDGSIIETEDEAHEETIFWLYENHPDLCPKGWNPDDEEVHSAETFIVYPELYEYLMMQDLLRSDKTSTKHLQDDDYEITVPSYLMDDILAAVSEYQSTEKSDSDLVFGQSKTTVAVAAAGVALVGAWLWNKRK